MPLDFVISILHVRTSFLLCQHLRVLLLGNPQIFTSFIYPLEFGEYKIYG